MKTSKHIFILLILFSVTVIPIIGLLLFKLVGVEKRSFGEVSLILFIQLIQIALIVFAIIKLEVRRIWLRSIFIFFTVIYFIGGLMNDFHFPFNKFISGIGIAGILLGFLIIFYLKVNTKQNSKFK